MPYPKSSVATIRLNATIIENTPMTTAPSGEYFDPRHRLLQFQAPVRVPYRTLHPSKSAYRFRQTRSAEGLSPESSNHPSLLISSISWTDDGIDSPAHRVRPRARGPWEDDPPRPHPRHGSRGTRSGRHHAAHRRDGGPSRGHHGGLRRSRERQELPHPGAAVHRHPGPRGLLDLAGSRWRPLRPRRPRDRRQRGIPPADDPEPEHPKAVQDAVPRGGEQDRPRAWLEETRRQTLRRILRGSAPFHARRARQTHVRGRGPLVRTRLLRGTIRPRRGLHDEYRRRPREREVRRGDSRPPPHADRPRAAVPGTAACDHGRVGGGDDPGGEGGERPRDHARCDRLRRHVVERGHDRLWDRGQTGHDEGEAPAQTEPPR